MSHSKFKSLVRARRDFDERRHKFECRYVRPCISPALSLDQPMLTAANIVSTREVMAALGPYLEDGSIALDNSSGHVKVYNICLVSYDWVGVNQ